MKKLKLNMANRYPNHVELTLIERDAMKKAVVEKFGSYRAFTEQTGIIGISNIANGHRRACPKKLARIKQALGV